MKYFDTLHHNSVILQIVSASLENPLKASWNNLQSRMRVRRR